MRKYVANENSSKIHKGLIWIWNVWHDLIFQGLRRGADVLDIDVQMLDHHLIGPEHETHTLITTI